MIKKMDKEEIPARVLEAVKKACPDNRLNCPQAMELAKELGVPPLMIGAAADHLEIKLYGCQLGCFG